MKLIKIQSDEKNIHLDCPFCDNWEQLGIDEARKNLQSFSILEWGFSKEFEITETECNDCKEKFIIEWDYNNPLK